jgi:hypothetical protein
MQYGDWKKPPKDKSKPWVWHEHGDWKKIYKKKDIPCFTLEECLVKREDFPDLFNYIKALTLQATDNDQYLANRQELLFGLNAKLTIPIDFEEVKRILEKTGDKSSNFAIIIKSNILNNYESSYESSSKEPVYGLDQVIDWMVSVINDPSRSLEKRMMFLEALIEALDGNKYKDRLISELQKLLQSTEPRIVYTAVQAMISYKTYLSGGAEKLLEAINNQIEANNSSFILHCLLSSGDNKNKNSSFYRLFLQGCLEKIKNFSSVIEKNNTEFHILSQPLFEKLDRDKYEDFVTPENFRALIEKLIAEPNRILHDLRQNCLDILVNLLTKLGIKEIVEKMSGKLPLAKSLEAAFGM